MSRAGWLAAVAILALAIAAPVLAAAYPALLRIPPRVPRPAPAPALFSHRTHGGFGCFACHPGTVPEAAVGFTHEEMRAGKFCGRCHDGQGAFAISAARCERCHVPR